jgi:Tol biopolymer transport system component
MKRCPECRKDYLDDSLLYCLDDGTPLVQGSVTDEPATAILSGDRAVDEGVTAVLKGDGTVAPSGPITLRLPGFLSWERLPWALAALLLVALVALSVRSFRSYRPSASGESTKVAFTIQPSGRSSGQGQISISPDGRTIAAIATTDATSLIWLRPIDSIEGRVVPGTEGAAGFPFWSPDGRSIGFQAAGKLKRLDLADGTVRDLTDLPSDVRGFDGTWNRDGTIVYFMGGSGLFQIAASGGKPTFVPGYEQRPDGIDRWPQFLPDGRHFIFLATGSDQAKSEVFVGSANSPERKLLFESDSNALYSPSTDGNSGHILFARGGALLAQGFDAAAQKLIGEPFRVAERIRINFNSRAFFSVSENGSLIYDPSSDSEESRQITRYDRAGKAIGTVGQPGPIQNLELSPDDRFLAITRRSIGAVPNDVMIFDTLRGGMSRLATTPGDTPQTIWSPDSKFVIWNDFSDGKFRLLKKLASGAGEAEVLLESPVRLYPTSWSPDGRVILYTAVDNASKRDIWVLPLDGDRKPYVFFKSPLEDRDADFSPNGKYVVYTSEESGKNEIYVQTFPASADKWTVSINGGFSPSWNQKSREIVYVQTDGKLMSVPVKADSTFEAGVPQALFDITMARAPRGDDYAMSNDGQRLMFISRGTDGSLPPVNVILNWSAGLGK